MSYLEGRLDMSVAKLQVITEIFSPVLCVLEQLNTKPAVNITQLEDSSLLDYPEDGVRKLLPKSGTNVVIYMTSFPRILESSLALL